MEISILNSAFVAIKIFENYDEFFWVDRYDSAGEFEMKTSSDANTLTLLEAGRYLQIDESDHMMIIEDHNPKTDIEQGDYAIISGRSLESILDRRIVWVQTILKGNFQSAIKGILTDAIINPSDPKRKIPNFVFKLSSDPKITALTIDTQTTGDNLYALITALCKLNKIGFKITLNELNQFVFELYAGVDRSYAQISNPHVIFSPTFDNIISSDFYSTTRTLKTDGLVAGEGEGIDRRTVAVGLRETGLSRRENFIDAREISSNVDGGTLPPAEYDAQLSQKGEKELSKSIITTLFEAEIESSNQFIYRKHFYIGDLVQVEDKAGNEKASIVDTLIITPDSIIPTFKMTA